MGFTLGGMAELKDPDVRLMLAIGPDGRMQAVTSWLPVYRDGEVVGWTIDFMRRADDSMNGVMEFLIASAALHMKEEGAEVLSLSGAPLAAKPLAPGEEPPEPTAMSRLLEFLAATLEPAYGFSSLFRFKAKFNPEYETISMAYPDALALPVDRRGDRPGVPARGLAEGGGRPRRARSRGDDGRAAMNGMPPAEPPRAARAGRGRRRRRALGVRRTRRRAADGRRHAQPDARADVRRDAAATAAPEPEPAVVEPVEPAPPPPRPRRRSRRCPLPSGTITALPGDGSLLAWTVDDGTSTEVIAAYAAFAAASGIRLTMFVTGTYLGVGPQRRHARPAHRLGPGAARQPHVVAPRPDEARRCGRRRRAAAQPRLHRRPVRGRCPAVLPAAVRVPRRPGRRDRRRPRLHRADALVRLAVGFRGDPGASRSASSPASGSCRSTSSSATSTSRR